ncbi:GntR family transcriptional regulator [Candidatus Atribacteria bacterium MT.SAG.1]|nr:GntR family transcriptional regulator [Candidatus Atribacteria bacterium MT.SAG.1]
MIENKNNKINLYTDPDKDKFVNKKIGDNFPNLEDQVYKIIKDKIIWHEIKMRERIIDKKLAEELGVSRSMVRQVLTALVKEELLVMIPRNGFYVREITKKEIEEIYEIRKVLEVYAIKRAIPRIPDRDIAELEKVFKEPKKRLEKNDTESFIEIDIKLHNLIINNCNNSHIKKIIDKFRNLVNFYRFADQHKISRAKELYFEHLEIFKSIKRRNIELAAESMSNHIENSKKNILKNYEKYTYG